MNFQPKPFFTDAFTDSAISAKVNGKHKEKDLEPWDAGELTANEELEALENDVSNGWYPNNMFRYNEENYGVVSTYDSSLSLYMVPLERNNSGPGAVAQACDPSTLGGRGG